MKVILEKYNPNWEIEFIHLKEVLSNNLNNVYEIIHIGSTSLKGMTAKPIIDVLISYDDESKFLKCRDTLINLGFIYEGFKGINDRHSFRRKDILAPYNDKYTWNYDLHLYATYKGSIPYLNNTLFINHLRNNKEDFDNYIKLKEDLVNNNIPRSEYTFMKTDFIISVLEKTTINKDIINHIKEENKK